MPDTKYAPECYACPIGTVSMALQAAAPDATEHLIRAGRELVGAFKSMLDGLDAFLNTMEERRAPAPVQSIPIKRR